MARALPATFGPLTSTRSNATSIAWNRRAPKRGRSDEHSCEVCAGRRRRRRGPKGRRQVDARARSRAAVIRRAKVWHALTDPAELREWAPFDADRNLGAVGPVKLSTVATPTPRDLGDERHARRGTAAARVQLGRERHAVGAGAARQRHAPHALAQHRPQVRRDGRGRLAHLLRRARPVPRRPRRSAASSAATR